MHSHSNSPEQDNFYEIFMFGDLLTISKQCRQGIYQHFVRLSHLPQQPSFEMVNLNEGLNLA